MQLSHGAGKAHGTLTTLRLPGVPLRLKGQPQQAARRNGASRFKHLPQPRQLRDKGRVASLGRPYEVVRRSILMGRERRAAPNLPVHAPNPGSPAP